MPENSVIPPPPPPPLALRTVVNSVKSNKEIDYHVELEALINLRKESSSRQIFQSFHSVKPQKQEGPTCGMVALSMALSNDNRTVSVDALMKTALANGWTNIGEMYSCGWMAELAEIHGAKAICIKGGIQNHLECIADCIIRGGRVLIPYDKDKDHSPGLFEGATAHWALVTGLICLESSSNEIEVGGSFSPCDCASASEKDVDRCEVWPLSGYPIGAWVGVSSGALTVGVKSQILRDHFAVPYFAAFQGLSSHVMLWPFLKLAASNNNLKKEGSTREGQVRLPPGGVIEGLRGQAVLLTY